MEIHCGKCGLEMKEVEYLGKTMVTCEKCTDDYNRLFEAYCRIQSLYNSLQDHLKALLQ